MTKIFKCLILKIFQIYKNHLKTLTTVDEGRGGFERRPVEGRDHEVVDGPEEDVAGAGPGQDLSPGHFPLAVQRCGVIPRVEAGRAAAAAEADAAVDAAVDVAGVGGARLGKGAREQRLKITQKGVSYQSIQTYNIELTKNRILQK